MNLYESLKEISKYENILYERMVMLGKEGEYDCKIDDQIRMILDFSLHHFAKYIHMYEVLELNTKDNNTRMMFIKNLLNKTNLDTHINDLQ